MHEQDGVASTRVLALVDEGDLHAIGVEGLHRVFLIGPRNLRAGTALCTTPIIPKPEPLCCATFGS